MRDVPVGHQRQEIIHAGVAVVEPVLHPQGRQPRAAVRAQHAVQAGHAHVHVHIHVHTVAVAVAAVEGVHILEHPAAEAGVALGAAEEAGGAGTAVAADVAVGDGSDEVLHAFL